MTKPLIFYDIPGLASPSKAWSPNTWNARLVLNMKGLPYEIVWVEYPDVAPLCERIGAERTSSAEPQYTLPVLRDPNIGAVVSNSFRIVQYLDETYSSTARAIPDGTEVFHKMFGAVVQEKVMIPLYHTVAESLHRQLAPRGQDYFRRTREESFGRKIEDIAPADAVRDEHWRQVMAGLSVIHGWIGHEKTFGRSAKLCGLHAGCAAAVGADYAWCGLEGVGGGYGGRWGEVETADREDRKVGVG